MIACFLQLISDKRMNEANSKLSLHNSLACAARPCEKLHLCEQASRAKGFTGSAKLKHLTSPA